MFSSSKILIKLIAVILLCSLPKLTNSWTFVDTATKANFPLGLAHLEITRRNNLSSRCTGVVIANHTVLTAAHCIDDFPSKITIDLNRAGPFNNLKCAEYKFWNPRKKQCIRRKVVNYKVNRYFRENGLDDYFYDKIPKSVALMSKDIRQHPKYLSVKNDFMKNPAERWLENDIAILSVKKGFFSSEARSTMYKSTFRINQDSEIPSTDREKWPYGYLLGSGYGKFKPLNYQEVIKEKNILEKFKKMYFDDPATYQKAKRDYFFNQVRARTGHSSIISNNRLRREMLMETDYDLVMNIDRGIFIENLLGYNNKSQVVDFPKEYLASVGYYTKNNPFREQYQNQKSHALLPTIKPTMCYGDSGGPMWQWFLIPKKESESSADVDDIKKDNLEKTSPNNNNNLFSIVGQYPLEQSSKIDSGEDESEKSKEIDTSKNYERVPYLFGIMSLMDDDCQQFMISVRVSEHLDFIRRSCSTTHTVIKLQRNYYSSLIFGLLDSTRDNTGKNNDKFNFVVKIVIIQKSFKNFFANPPENKRNNTKISNMIKASVVYSPNKTEFTIYREFFEQNFLGKNRETLSTLLSNNWDGAEAYTKYTGLCMSNALFPNDATEDGKKNFMLELVDTDKPESDGPIALITAKIDTIENMIIDIPKQRNISICTLHSLLNNSYSKLISFIWSEIKQSFTNGKILDQYKSNVEIAYKIVALCHPLEFLKSNNQNRFTEISRKNEKIFYVKAGCTKADKIKMGLGTKIRRECMTYCYENRINHMMVEASGVGTCKIYKKLGWEEISSVSYESLIGKYFVDNEANRRFIAKNPAMTLFYKYLETKPEN